MTYNNAWLKCLTVWERHCLPRGSLGSSSRATCTVFRHHFIPCTLQNPLAVIIQRLLNGIIISPSNKVGNPTLFARGRCPTHWTQIGPNRQGGYSGMDKTLWLYKQWLSGHPGRETPCLTRAPGRTPAAAITVAHAWGSTSKIARTV